jgi:hypothetical protein
MVDSLDIGVMKLQNNESIQPRFFVDAAGLKRDFADDCHFLKKEGVILFPAAFGVILLSQHD